MQITQAGSADYATIRALLAEAGLPFTDLKDSGQVCFLMVRTHGGTASGIVGIEQYGSAGLLRSLVVSPAQRKQGLGAQLVASVETHARQNGVLALYLLTTTAERFFLQLGYSYMDRSCVPRDIGETGEFKTLCPSTAVCLHKRL